MEPGRRQAWRLELLAPLVLVALAAFFWNFGFGMYRTVFHNFFVEDLRLGAQHLGWLEGIREIPGLLTMLLAAVTLAIAPARLAGWCILTMAAGLGLFALARGFEDLIVYMLIFSTGFHLLYPLQSALVLRFAEPGQKGRRIGQLEGLASAASLVAMGLVFVTAHFFELRQYFWIGAGGAALGAFALFALQSRDDREVIPAKALQRRFVLRRAYMPYYILTLLGGARRHIFLTFASFNLVQVHGVPVSNIAALLAVSHMLALYARPLMGRLVDQFGERRVFIISYLSVTGIVLGYAGISYLPALYVLFCLDQVFRVEMVTTTYLDKIAPTADLAPSLAAGSSVNHITGVLVPVMGGYLWVAYGPSATFFAGAVISFLSLLYCLKLPDAKRYEGGAETSLSAT
ncbi:MAG: MFS transporter [Thermaerobacterales bacterium]